MVSDFEFFSFGFVSDFDIRISDLVAASAPYLGGGASLTQRKPVCDRPVSGDDFIRALGR